MAGEFTLIDRYFKRPQHQPGTVLGPGDDCALIAPGAGLELAVTTDMLVSGVHFLPDTDPARLGWKSLAVNLSDLAAMGALPRWVTLAGALPATLTTVDPPWLEKFAEGLFACAAAYGVDLIGGDTTRGPLTLAITAIGEVEPGQALRRSGARIGDCVWVSGRPGLASLGLACLQNRPETRALPESWRRLCIAALEKPRPRVELGRALRGIASAAIDVSDGLLADLGHLCTNSGVAASLSLVQLPHLPKGEEYDADLRRIALECQLAGGDDYELCFTAAGSQSQAIAAIAARLELPLWHIGEIVPATSGEPVTVYDPDLKPVEFARKGYDHFA